MLEVTMNKWKPSRIACSCLYLAKKLLNKKKPWSDELKSLTQLTLTEVRKSGPELLPLLNMVEHKRVFEII